MFEACIETSRQTFSHCRLQKSCVGSGLPPRIPPDPGSGRIFGQDNIKVRQRSNRDTDTLSYDTSTMIWTKTFQRRKFRDFTLPEEMEKYPVPDYSPIVQAISRRNTPIEGLV